MNHTKLTVAAVLLLAMILQPAFAAGSMRCGAHIISAGGRHGPGQYEVLKKCGEPTTRFGDTWVYVESGKADRVLYFDANGNLTHIEI